MAIEDGIELGVTGVTSSSREEGAGVGDVGRDVDPFKKEVFSSDCDGLVAAVTGNVDCAHEGAIGVNLTHGGEVEGGVPTDLCSRELG